MNELGTLPSLELNQCEIKRVKKTKSLGIIVDEGLSWKDQYKSLLGKLAGGLSSLKKLKDILPQSKLCDVYRAIFESHLRYGDVIWGSLSATNLHTLQRLQNRAISIIERAKIKDHWQNNLLNIETLIRFDRSVMVYKVVNKLCPESLWDMYEQRCNLSSYNTRNNRDLHIPKVNLEHRKKGFRYSGIKIWNDIPLEIRELSSLTLFKKKLKGYLLNNDNSR